MSKLAEEIKSYYGIAEQGGIQHYGMPRRSGRYPWGSGDDPYQRTRDFLGRYEELKKQGLSEKDIAREMGIFDDKGNPSTGKLRTQYSYAKDDRRILQMETAKRLRDKEGLGPTEIGRRMGINESSVRSLLDPGAEARTRLARNTAEFIKKQIDEKGMIDVGAGVEKELNISSEKMKEALLILENEGYPVYSGRFPQTTNPGQWTTQKVICPPDTPHKDIYQLDKVHALNEDDYISTDDGKSFRTFQYPASMDSKRLMVRYAEDGGIDKDGIVELRRGVEDLSLGEGKHYAQVRILVDDKKYIKGMAVYSDDMPDGVDVIFNTNKNKSVAKLDVLKDIKNDPDNPFGSLIKAGGQSEYTDKDGKKHLSLINKRADEGDWTEWKDALPSQFLGKQSLFMVKKQLGLAKADKLAQFEEIKSLENPTIKKHYLQEFADDCDAAAVHLKAAALPGQKYHVIIPVNTLKDTEVYAPNYESGTKLALVRYPHGGTFEIPVLTVNNKHMAAKKLIGNNSVDAVGINKKIADQLSGADFDGDTVMCIPTHDPKGKVKVTHEKYYKDLEGFDPKMAYPEREGMRYLGKKATQTQMGVISNLITDMTLGGADEDEMVRAVKHSMVVIDANKHKLDYKRSEIENNISSLKKIYQVQEDGKVGGAATILSRAKGETPVLKRQGTPKVNIKGSKDYDPTKPEGALIYKVADDLYRPVRSINKKTGIVTLTTISGEKIKYDSNDKESRNKYYPIKKVDKETGEISYTDKTGKIKYKLEAKTQKSTNMAETDDAYSLVSTAKHPTEMAYADYANSMKSLANSARKEMVSTGKVAYNSTAKKTYQAEYDSLMRKLNDAEKNKPRERAAQRQANAIVDAKKQKHYEETGTKMDLSDVKKANQQAITATRTMVGSVKRSERNIVITDREWSAIQAGAVSETILKRILNNTDPDSLRARAMPKTSSTLSAAQINKIKAMSASNYDTATIAKRMGISPSTVNKYLKGVS